MNSEEVKAPFDITIYPKEIYKTGKGEEKERYIVPDDIFEEHLKELPDNTINESKSFRAFHGGKLGIFGADPEADRKIQSEGGKTVQAAIRQRRTFKEQIDIYLAQKNRETGRTGLEDVALAMMERAAMGDVKAAQFLRDTAGEKPAETIDLSADITTEADRALMEKLKARMIDH